MEMEQRRKNPQRQFNSYLWSWQIAATRDKNGYTIQMYAYDFTRGVICDVERNNILT